MIAWPPELWQDRIRRGVIFGCRPLLWAAVIDWLVLARPTKPAAAPASAEQDPDDGRTRPEAPRRVDAPDDDYVGSSLGGSVRVRFGVGAGVAVGYDHANVGQQMPHHMEVTAIMVYGQAYRSGKMLFVPHTSQYGQRTAICTTASMLKM